MSKFARTALSAAVAFAGVAVASQAQAAVYLNLADINPAIGGIMGFNGVSMQSIGGLDDLRLSVGATVFANAHFDTVPGGWVVTNTLIADTDFNGVDAGDSITANIGPGSFTISNAADGILVFGTFTNAVLNTAVGSTAFNINVANVNGLNLVPGPAVIAAGVPDLISPESLAISVVGLNPGVSIAASAGIPATPFFTGTMNPFGLGQNEPTSGSVDMVAAVPEPATLGLVGLGALAFAARRRQRVAGKVMAFALAAGAVASVGSQSQAALMFMDLSDINAPIGGIAGFDGTSVVSLGGIDDFVVTGFPAFPNAHFDILNGFAVTTTVVGDANLNGLADPGEIITSIIGPGLFQVANPGGVIVTGSFTGATLSTSVGSSSVTINAADVNGLDLTPGPLLVGLGVTTLVDPEDFSVNVVGIDPGVAVNGVAVAFPGLLTGNLAPFAVGQAPSTSGSVNMSAAIPEPASLGLLSVGALGLIARRRRHA